MIRRREKCIYGGAENIRTWRPIYLSKEVMIHRDASKSQIGGLIVKNGKPIVFYLHKSTNT